MTGQGDPRLEQIKDQRRPIDRLDLQKEFRTIHGLRVRSLQYNYRKQRAFLFGELKDTGNMEQCITGQVKIKNEWTHQSWNTIGRHDINEDLNLVEFIAPPLPPAADLFKNITPGAL